MTQAALVALCAGLVASLVARPDWPLPAAAGLLWFGGAWRWLLPLASVAATVGALVANTLAPGRAWHAVRTAPGRLRSWAPGTAAAAIGVTAVAYSAGLLTGSVALTALRLYVLQLALSPATSWALLAAAATVLILAADARGERAVRYAGDYWRRRPRTVERTLRHSWPAVVVAVLAGWFAAALFPSAMQGWGHTDGPDAQRYNFYTSFFNYSFNDERVQQREGFDLGKQGLTLLPGRSGSIVFRLERPPDSVVLLKPNFYNRFVGEERASLDSPPFSNALDLSTDQGRSYRPILTDTSVGEVFGEQTLDLTPFVGTSQSYWLRFRATNTTDVESTVLPSFAVSVIVDPQALPHPTFPIAPYAAALALLAYAAGRCGQLSRKDAGLVALAASTCATVALVVAAGGAGEVSDASGAGVSLALLAARGALAAAALALLAVSWRRRRTGSAYRVPWLPITCLLVGLVALDVRWQQLVQVRYEFLLPDAQGYQAIAAEFPLKLAHYRAERPTPLLDALYAGGYDGRASVPAVFYAGGNNGREPLWPAVLRLVYNVLGVSAFHTRLTSLGLGVLVAALTCWLGWRALHPLVGVVAGLVVAFNRPFVVSNVAGLREELVTALFVFLLAGIFAGARHGGTVAWWRIVLAGAAAAGVVLVRADMVVLAGAALTIGALALRWPWRRWLAAVALMAILAGPMYVGYEFTHGDPFYPGTYGATVNRNLEFPDRMGTPGFPSPEAYAANWAAGPPISPLRYFFGYHTVPQFVAYSVRGFARIFAAILFKDQPLLLWLFVVGVALLLASRRWLVPFAVVVALMPFYAFLAGVPSPWVFAPRYAYHALPYAALAVGYAVWYGLWHLPVLLSNKWTSRTLWNGA